MQNHKSIQKQQPINLKWYRSAFLFGTSFIAGFVVLSLEISGFRMFAPYFGYSVYVSGSLITLVLVALSAGYYVGGYLADKNKKLDLMYKCMLYAGIYLTIITLTYQKILEACGALPPVAGTILATVIVYAPSMVLLSMVTPFLIRYISTAGKEMKIGTVVGTISSVSTIGSIAGTIITTFVLIPGIGTRHTLVLCDIIIVVLAVSYLFSVKKLYAFFLFVFALFLFMPPIELATSGKIVFADESIYNLIKVIYKDNNMQLQLNDAMNIQSTFTVDKTRSIFPHDQSDVMSVSPFLSNGKRVLILGLGGGTGANQLSLCYDSLLIDAVEIDPEVIMVAKHFFSVKNINPNLNIHVEDARPFLANSQKKWDIIQLDVYQGGPYMPFYLTTFEFFNAVEKHLTDNGVFVMNVLTNTHGTGGDEMYYTVGNTLKKAFKKVFVFNSPELPVNAVFFAVKNNMTLNEVKQKLITGKFKGEYATSTIPSHIAQVISEYQSDPKYKVLTDDKAPVERMTYEFLRLMIREARAKKGA